VLFLERENLSQSDMEIRMTVLRDAQKAIYPAFGDMEANLEMFGSTCNGFGNRASDVDMCLTFNNLKTRPAELTVS